MPISKALQSMNGFMQDLADLGDVQLHYVCVGTGKPMVFIHGFPEYWQIWERQLREFGKDHHAIAFDTRGINLSSKPSDLKLYELPHLMNDIKGLIEHFGHQKATLIAHDWGGAVAWSFAAYFADYVDKLIIINAPNPAVFTGELLYNPEQHQASKYMRLFQKPVAESLLKENNFELLSLDLWGQNSKWHPSDQEKNNYYSAWSQPGALTAGLNYYRASNLYPPKTEQEKETLQKLLQSLKGSFKVKVPTLVIWGEQDHALLPGNLNGLEEYVSDLSIKRIADGTHWVIHEQPEVVNSLIREFVAKEMKSHRQSASHWF